MDFSPEQRQTLLQIARQVVRATVARLTPPAPICHDLDLLQPAGCFVSLHGASHCLRGCIGRIESPEPLLGTVLAMAAAAVHDPRFVNQPITLAELREMDVELSVLSPMRPAPNPLAFEPGEHGIVLAIGQRNGVFLPQVARETGWSREQLLEKLCNQKLGMPSDAWKMPSARLSTFTAVVIGPVPVEPPEPSVEHAALIEV